MDELAWGVQALAAMAQQTWGIGFAIEIQEESAVHDG